MNQMTGFQLLATSGLQSGGGIAPPDITASYGAYSNLTPVSNYSNIYYTLQGMPTVIGTIANPVASVSANIVINNSNVVITHGDTLSQIISDIISADITGITANIAAGNVGILSDSLASYTVTIGATSNTTLLTDIGLSIGTFTGTTTGINIAALTALNTLGANSFPHLFGQIPQDFNSNLGFGPMIDITHARTVNWFGGSPTANVYTQVLGQAQAYATSASAVISSAATAQWPNGPAAAITGGFSNIGGNNPAQFMMVANAISQLGTLMVPSAPFNGFSNAGCFQQILNSGNEALGNLQFNFFGNNIIDPSNGNTWTINNDLFNYILDNPMGLSEEDPFQIAALNPFDTVLGEAANNALTQIGDLDAVLTYFGVGNVAAAQVFKWTDCLTFPNILGNAAPIINSVIGTETTTYEFIKTLVNNIPGITNITSMTVLGATMAGITPLSNAPQLSALSQPVSQSDFANIKATFGPGSGTNGNPTVDDVMGSTNYNSALTSVVQGIQPLTNTTNYANISADTTNIVGALHGASFPIILSNGNSYANINSLALDGAALINSEAAALASTVSNPAPFSDYNGIAETHNNSAQLNASFIPINVSAIVSNLLSDYQTFKGLYAMIVGIFFQVVGVSSSVYMNTLPKPALFLNTPGPPNSLAAFASALSIMAAVGSTIPGANEITGLGNVLNCLNVSTLAGQALSAVAIESTNAQALVSSGLNGAQNLAANPQPLLTAPTGTNTLGGGLIHG